MVVDYHALLIKRKLYLFVDRESVDHAFHLVSVKERVFFPFCGNCIQRCMAIHVQYLCNMSSGHSNVHWTFTLVQWTLKSTFECPVAIALRRIDISVCLMDDGVLVMCTWFIYLIKLSKTWSTCLSAIIDIRWAILPFGCVHWSICVIFKQ